MFDKLRVNLDGKKSCALTALIEDGLGKGACARPDFGDCRASFPIDLTEHLGGEISRTRCNGPDGTRVLDKPLEKLDPISVWQGYILPNGLLLDRGNQDPQRSS